MVCSLVTIWYTRKMLFFCVPYWLLMQPFDIPKCSEIRTIPLQFYVTFMQPNLYTHQLQLNAGQAHHCLWNVYSTEKKREVFSPSWSLYTSLPGQHQVVTAAYWKTRSELQASWRMPPVCSLLCARTHRWTDRSKTMPPVAYRMGDIGINSNQLAIYRTQLIPNY